MPLLIERLIVSEGGASHEFTTTGHSLRWSESSERIHLALAHPAARVRALVDLAAFDALHEAEEVARALARLVVTECAPLARVRLHPRVTAALLPSLALFPSLGIGQATHPATSLDGKGRPIDFCAPPANGIWPNWYRPSYRIRATRMPFHLDLAGEAATISAETPQAIALTAPVELRNEHLRLRALVVADGVAAERVIDIAISEWPQRLLAIGERAAWYPYAAGTWGRDALLTL